MVKAPQTDRSIADPVDRAPMRHGEPVELAVNARRLATTVLVGYVAIELLLLTLDYLVAAGAWREYKELRVLLDITDERGVANWFATTQALLVAVTLFLVAVAARLRPGERRSALGWAVLALFFAYLAFDDGTEFHERMTTVVVLATRDESTSAGELPGLFAVFPSYYWQLVFLPVFAGVALFMLVFLWRQLDDRGLKALMVASLGILALTVGLDFLEGLHRDHPWNPYDWLSERNGVADYLRTNFSRSPYRTLLHFGMAIEECAEMVAVSLLWYVFLRHGTRVATDLRVRFV